MKKRNGITYSVKRYGNMKDNYTRIHNDIFMLLNNGNQFMVYCYLCKMHNREYQYAFPKIEQIANDCGISPSTVKRCIKELQDMGLIKVLRFTNKTTRYSNNMYYIYYPVLDLETIGDEIEEEINNELLDDAMKLEIEEMENITFEIKNGKVEQLEDE